MKSLHRKVAFSALRIIGVCAGILFFCLLILFTGYIYALQSNPMLYIPGVSGPANSLIGVIWRQPFSYPSPTPKPTVLYGTIKPAPEFTGITKWYKDEAVSLRQFRGQKIVVLVFGRLYCSYCFNVYTYLTEWQRNYSSENVQVVALQSPHYDGEKSWKDIEAKIVERDVNFPVGLDENRSTAAAYNFDTVPTAYVIDKQGMIRYEHTGEGGFGEVEKAIQEVIFLDFDK